MLITFDYQLYTLWQFMAGSELPTRQEPRLTGFLAVWITSDISRTTNPYTQNQQTFTKFTHTFFWYRKTNGTQKHIHIVFRVYFSIFLGVVLQ